MPFGSPLRATSWNGAPPSGGRTTKLPFSIPPQGVLPTNAGVVTGGVRHIAASGELQTRLSVEGFRTLARAASDALPETLRRLRDGIGRLPGRLGTLSALSDKDTENCPTQTRALVV
jgi:hypothetical protein